MLSIRHYPLFILIIKKHSIIINITCYAAYAIVPVAPGQLENQLKTAETFLFIFLTETYQFEAKTIKQTIVKA